LGEGVSLAFDFDPFAHADRLHKSVNDFLARFRIAFDQPLPDDLSEPRDGCRRYACRATIKLLA